MDREPSADRKLDSSGDEGDTLIRLIFTNIYLRPLSLRVFVRRIDCEDLTYRYVN